jgi:hypothetical protein
MLTRLVALSATLASLATLVACEELPGMIAPFDGRTNLDAREPLRVQGGANQIPPDYPAGNVITVVDLLDGGFVDGTVVTDGMDVLFHPAADWPTGRRLAWTFMDPDHVPHGPEMPVEVGLRGTAVFSADDGAEVLAVEEDGGRPCLVLSQPIEDVDALVLRVTVDDVDVESIARSLDGAWDPYDAGATAMCLDGVSVAPGQSVRVWVDGRGPWRHPAEAHDTIVARLFRESP